MYQSAEKICGRWRFCYIAKPPPTAYFDTDLSIQYAQKIVKYTFGVHKLCNNLQRFAHNLCSLPARARSRFVTEWDESDGRGHAPDVGAGGPGGRVAWVGSECWLFSCSFLSSFVVVAFDPCAGVSVLCI